MKQYYWEEQLTPTQHTQAIPIRTGLDLRDLTQWNQYNHFLHLCEPPTHTIRLKLRIRQSIMDTIKNQVGRGSYW